jgi:hypothetical protein
MDIGELDWESVNWVYQAQDRGLWCALVNMVITFSFHKR